MIPKLQEKKKAIALRKVGFSYYEIRQRVPVSKSTLSLWLRSIGLAKKQTQRLTEKRIMAQKKAVQAWMEKRIQKTIKIKQEAASEVMFLTKRERWLMGICLYWAEGTKERGRSTLLRFSNSDPRMVLFFREWVLDFLKIDPDEVRYTLAIHEKSKNIYKSIKFWSDILHIELHELRLSLKKHNPSPKRKNIHEDYRGLIRLEVARSTDMVRKIAGWIDGIMQETKIIGE